MMKLLLLICLIALPVSAETQADRVDAIARQLMCPVCAGQSVAESNAQLARDMREIIKRKVSEGVSDEEIISWFRTKYGDGILAEPPLKGFNLVVWLFPITAAAIGVLFAVVYIRRNLKG